MGIESRNNKGEPKSWREKKKKMEDYWTNCGLLSTDPQNVEGGHMSRRSTMMSHGTKNF